MCKPFSFWKLVTHSPSILVPKIFVMVFDSLGLAVLLYVSRKFWFSFLLFLEFFFRNLAWVLHLSHLLSIRKWVLLDLFASRSFILISMEKKSFHSFWLSSTFYLKNFNYFLRVSCSLLLRFTWLNQWRYELFESPWHNVFFLYNRKYI